MILLDYFVRLPSLAAYTPMIRLRLYILTGRKYSTVGVYTYLSANSVQEKLLSWSPKLMNSVANIRNFIS